MTKTKYLIPVFAAVFALMFVVATPYVMADGGMWKDGTHAMGPKDHMRHHVIVVDGFSGAITVPQEMTPEAHAALKSQVSVSLYDAAVVAKENGFTGATQAKIGIVDDGASNASVAWILSSKSRDVETNTMTVSIFVVDAGNADNFKTITNTFDHSMKEGMHSGDENAEPARDQL